MEKIKVNCTIEGVAPLEHNNPWNIKAQLQKTSKTTGACQEYDERQLYRNKKGECCIPSRHIKGALKEAAKRIKYGRSNIVTPIKATVFMEDEFIPIKTNGKNSTVKEPDDIDENIFGDKAGKMHLVERPMFDVGWKAEFTMMMTGGHLPAEKLHECLILAGELFGIGCRRPDCGRFIVPKFKAEKVK